MERAAPAGPTLQAGQLWQLVRESWSRLLTVRPLFVLASLVLVQWLAVAAVALTVRHNGWLWYQGGDQTFYYSSAWSIAHGHLPQSSIGYGWSLLFAPLAAVVGPNILAALPIVILVQTLVLLPLGLVGVYGIGARIGGRTLGYLAAVCWVTAPVVAIPGFIHRFHPVYLEAFLPQAYGLTALSDFVSMILVIGAAYAFLRALDTHGDADAALAGSLAGFAIGVKPANVFFLAGPLLAVIVSRRPRTAALYVAAMLPAVIALALWKEKGVGHVPLLSSSGEAKLAAGPAGGGVPLGALGLSRYVHLLHWSHFRDNMDQFREYFWSGRLVEWIPIAGIIALLRVSAVKAAFVGGWLAAFVFIKGSSLGATVQDGTFFRLLMPAWPAYVLCVAALPFLVPGLGRGVCRSVRSVWPLQWHAAPVVVALVVFAGVPLVAMAALPPQHDRSIVDEFNYDTVVPVTSFHLTARVEGRRVVLSWKQPRPTAPSTRVFYRIYRSTRAGQPPIGGVVDYHDGIACSPPTGGAASCRVLMTLLGPTGRPPYVDRPMGYGQSATLTYRVGLLANWLDDYSRGDVLLLSAPVEVGLKH